MKVRYEENFPLELIDETNEQFQARLDYDEGELETLLQDIAQNGQRNPVGLIQKDDRYQLIYGFQRLKVIKELSWKTLHANIYEDATEKELHIHSISDNIRQAQLTDLEKALKAKHLKGMCFSTEELCELFSVKKSAIYNYLTVADLDETTHECLQRGLISLNHAVELVRLQNSKRLEKLKTVLSLQLSVNELKTGHYHARMLALDGWVNICPQSMHMKPLYECKECPYHEGIKEEGDRSWVSCNYDHERPISLPLKKLYEVAP